MGDALIGIDILGGNNTGHFSDLCLYRRDTGRTTNQQHLAQFTGSNTGIVQSIADRACGAVHQIPGQLIEFVPGQCVFKVDHTILTLHQIGQADHACFRAGQFFLCLFCCFVNPLHGRNILAGIHTVFPAQFIDQIIDDPGIEIIATQVVVAVGGKHLNHTVTDLNNGHVKGAAAQVIDHDLLCSAVIQTIGKGRRGRFVDNSLYIQSCNTTGILGCLPLDIIEVSRNSNNGIGHFLAQILFGILTELPQDHGADLLGCIFLSVNDGMPVCTHVPFHRADGTAAVDRCLTLCGIAHQPFPVWRKGYHTGSGSSAFFIGNNNGSATFNHTDTAIGGTQINTDCLAHNILSFPLNTS